MGEGRLGGKGYGLPSGLAERGDVCVCVVCVRVCVCACVCACVCVCVCVTPAPPPPAPPLVRVKGEWLRVTPNPSLGTHPESNLTLTPPGLPYRVSRGEWRLGGEPLRVDPGAPLRCAGAPLRPRRSASRRRRSASSRAASVRLKRRRDLHKRLSGKEVAINPPRGSDKSPGEGAGFTEEGAGFTRAALRKWSGGAAVGARGAPTIYLLDTIIPGHYSNPPSLVPLAEVAAFLRDP